MSDAFLGLQPEIVWKSFEGLTRTPRGSGAEQKVVEHMLAWAKAHGFEAAVDRVNNVLVRVPGTPGQKDRAPVALQGHLDMVCEKNQDVQLDFETQPIPVVRDGDWIKAAGTTLGADNGIGCAMAMAVATDPAAQHGPLELLFTVDEERGLTGAFNLGHEVHARRLINIDSEEEGHIFVGCAGGADTETVFPLRILPLLPGREVVTLKVTGCIGGHSGLTIHENRANALKLCAMLLSRMFEKEGGALCRLEGGDKHNAIPREAEAVVAGRKGLAKRLEKRARALKVELLKEFGQTDPKLELIVTPAQADKGLPAAAAKKLIRLLLAFPHGVDVMSKDLPGLVETSCNMARIRWEERGAVILHSSRSSVAPALERLRERIGAVGLLAGAQVTQNTGYPGWQPNMASAVLAKAREVYLATTGKTAEVKAIHAGLECGIIGMRYPGMDMISIGPDMFDVHSPQERLSISSTARFYDFLKALLATL